MNKMLLITTLAIASSIQTIHSADVAAPKPDTRSFLQKAQDKAASVGQAVKAKATSAATAVKEKATSAATTAKAKIASGAAAVKAKASETAEDAFFAAMVSQQDDLSPEEKKDMLADLKKGRKQTKGLSPAEQNSWYTDRTAEKITQHFDALFDRNNTQRRILNGIDAQKAAEWNKYVDSLTAKDALIALNNFIVDQIMTLHEALASSIVGGQFKPSADAIDHLHQILAQAKDALAAKQSELLKVHVITKSPEEKLQSKLNELYDNVKTEINALLTSMGVDANTAAPENPFVYLKSGIPAAEKAQDRKELNDMVSSTFSMISKENRKKLQDSYEKAATLIMSLQKIAAPYISASGKVVIPAKGKANIALAISNFKASVADINEQLTMLKDLGGHTNVATKQAGKAFKSPTFNKFKTKVTGMYLKLKNELVGLQQGLATAR